MSSHNILDQVANAHIPPDGVILRKTPTAAQSASNKPGDILWVVAAVAPATIGYAKACVLQIPGTAIYWNSGASALVVPTWTALTN